MAHAASAVGNARRRGVERREAGRERTTVRALNEREGDWLLEGDTMSRLFWEAVQRRADRVIVREKDLGIWRAVTWHELGEKARCVGHGLISLGFEPGDCASVLANTVKEWLFADMGILGAGGVCSGIYPTDAPAQVEYLVNDSRSRYLFVEDEEQLDKILAVRERTPALEKVIVFDMEGLRDFSDPMVISFDELLEMGAAHAAANPDLWLQRVNSREPDDLAILVYTSGTTGPPKGAMISHRNLVCQCRNSTKLLPQAENDERLSFLPMCHVAERVVGCYFSLYTSTIMNFVENPDTVPENVREVAPTVFGAVPRIWEKFYSGVTIAVSDATALQKWAYKTAIGIGLKCAELKIERKPVPAGLKLLNWLGSAIVLRNVRKMIGVDRCRWLVTGAAPISPDLIRWYMALGLDMLEVYGATETTALTSIMPAGAIKPGTVGLPVDFGEVKISPEGEILVRGDYVFMGYLNLPEKTAETIVDGWLHTGDVGYIDNEGYLKITDRMKDIIITAGGKNITPSEIENQIKFSPYVSDAVVIGDARKYLTCLVMIDYENVAKYAQDQDVPFTNYASLCNTNEVQDLIWGEIERVNKNFAQVEQIKKCRLIDQELTAEDDELTPTMKLKRKFVNEKYKDLIESMY
jgi:long-chain acyl-CoA synthetase